MGELAKNSKEERHLTLLSFCFVRSVVYDILSRAWWHKTGVKALGRLRQVIVSFRTT